MSAEEVSENDPKEPDCINAVPLDFSMHAFEHLNVSNLILQLIIIFHFGIFFELYTSCMTAIMDLIYCIQNFHFFLQNIYRSVSRGNFSFFAIVFEKVSQRKKRRYFSKSPIRSKIRHSM